MVFPNVSGCNPRLSAEPIEVLTSSEHRPASQLFKSDEIARYATDTCQWRRSKEDGKRADRLMIGRLVHRRRGLNRWPPRRLSIPVLALIAQPPTGPSSRPSRRGKGPPVLAA